MKLSLRIFVLAFVLIISVPFFGRLALRGTTPGMVLETENRQVTAFHPLTSWRRGKMKEWFRNNDFWIADRLAKKDFVVRTINTVLSDPKYFYSMDFSRGLYGQEGFLFLGNNYARVLDRHLSPDFSLSYEARERLLNQHTNLQRVAHEQKATYVLFAAPDKHGIFCEKLPSFLTGKNACRKTSRVTRDLQKDFEKKGVSLVYPFDEVRHENAHTIYFKADTHWKMTGAEVGFFALMDHLTNRGLRFSGKTFASTKGVNYRLETTPLGQTGDLRTIIGVPNDYVISDTGVRFVSTVPVRFSELDSPEISIPAQKVAIYGWKARWKGTVINSSAPNKARVLIFCDSFMTAMSPFFFSHFQDTYFFSYYGRSQKELEQAVRDVKPDLVVFETVERALY